ncbi:hypothetical protein D3C75_459270 [compost metagenome]
MGKNDSRTVQQKSKAIVRLDGADPRLNGIKGDILRHCPFKPAVLIMERNPYVYRLNSGFCCISIAYGQLVSCLNGQIPGTLARIKGGVRNKSRAIHVGSVLQAKINGSDILFVLRQLKGLQMLHADFFQRYCLFNNRTEGFDYFSISLRPAVNFSNSFLDGALQLFINRIMCLLLDQKQ